LLNLTVDRDGETVFFKAGFQDMRILKTENYLPVADAPTEQVTHMARRILHEAGVILIETALLLAVAAVFGVSGDRKQGSPVEAAVSFEESLSRSGGESGWQKQTLGR
jgi:hypothetical protein